MRPKFNKQPLITQDFITTLRFLHLPHTSNGKQWKWRTRFLVGLVVLIIIVTAVVVGAVFLGKQLTTDSFQTFQASYKTNNKNDASETITVGATEVKFQIKGVADVVLDFDKGLSMYMRRDEERSLCFLTTFNASEGMAPKELKEYLEKTQGTIEAQREIQICYKYTNVSITNRNFLSPITKAMCSNVEIFWMINDDCASLLHGRQKRGSVTVSLFWGAIKVTVRW
ncbi:hypothetical protein CHS0354_021504 [Potamilus streckersoni]|uniref:BRICHOS domain-containing protein n=1 Tax=Potamilus streckersoni TaxID=2493646 RepID=A0AAE0SAA6_9BIVA|nr:hypothetical protein CHS0354_021504 [Potamilus streckersoni]